MAVGRFTGLGVFGTVMDVSAAGGRRDRAFLAASAGASPVGLDSVARTAPAAIRQRAIRPRTETGRFRLDSRSCPARPGETAFLLRDEGPLRLSISRWAGRKRAGFIVHRGPSSPRIMRCRGACADPFAGSSRRGPLETRDGPPLPFSASARHKAKGAAKTSPATDRVSALVVNLRLRTRRWRFTSSAQVTRWRSSHSPWPSKSSRAAATIRLERRKALLARAILASTWSGKRDTDLTPTSGHRGDVQTCGERTDFPRATRDARG